MRALAEEGARVVAGARTVDTLAGLDGVTAVAVDLARPGGPEAARRRGGRAATAASTCSSTTSAASTLRLDGFLATTDADFEASLQLNFFAALRATRAAVAAMLAAGGGAIVNVASVNAFFHPDGLVIDYGAAKAALLNFAKALSQELGPQGIRINSVSPGPVATDLWLGDDGVAATLGAAAGIDAAAVREQAIAGIATGRFTTPDEVATLVALLASPRTANVTGVELRDRRRARQDDVSVWLMTRCLESIVAQPASP